MSANTCVYQGCDYVLDMARLQSLLVGLVIVSCLIAIATMAIMQFIKPSLRGMLQRRVTRNWLDKRFEKGDFDAGDQPSWLSEWALRRRVKLARLSFDDLDTGGPLSGSAATRYLTNEFYMREIQNEAGTVLQHPSAHMRPFFALSRDASPADRATIIWADAIRRAHPSMLPEAEVPQHNPGSESAEAATRTSADRRAASAIDAAQDKVAAACERALDELQLQLTGSWAYGGRCLALAVGILVALAAAAAVRAVSPLTLVVGLSGGALGSMLYDAASAVVFRRGR